MQKDFQDFLNQITRDNMETICNNSNQYGSDSQHQAFSIALHLIELYDTWQKSDSSGDTE